MPTHFEITAAKVNDRKALENLPTLENTTYVVDRAYNDYGWYYELHQKNSKVVGRMKKDAKYTVMKENDVYEEGVVSDEIIRFSAKKAQKECPINMRRVTFIRKEDQKELVFLTNDLDRSAGQIAALYKQRWQIELFFKWIKQNLKIKQFLGRSENAVMIQILVAMIAYLLLKIIKLTHLKDISLLKLSRLIGINIMNRLCISELINPDKAAAGRLKNERQLTFKQLGF